MLFSYLLKVSYFLLMSLRTVHKVLYFYFGFVFVSVDTLFPHFCICIPLFSALSPPGQSMSFCA
jgi:hypothetical protein